MGRIGLPQQKYFWVRRVLGALILASLLVGIFHEPGLAQSATPSDDAVNQIASQLYCPMCENITLDDCTTQACRQMRELIRQQLAEGWTDQEIKDYFVAQYGDRVLGDPPVRGLNWVLYGLPPVALLGGIVLVIWLIKRKPTETTTQSKTDRGDDPYLYQVEQDLKKLD